MTISLSFNEEDALLIKKYAELNKLSVPDFIRQTVMDHIETEHDLQMFDKAMAEYRENPTTYSLDNVKIELNLQ